MILKGKLFVIDGTDCSGKETACEKVYKMLESEGNNVIKVTFPDYESASSSLVKMYLNGEFGEKPSDVSPYIASTFYAADRYASYKTKWHNFYNSGGIVVCDRYTTSNMIHQAAKIKDIDEKNKFLEWLWDFEFNIYRLPMPDEVIFLDMPVEYSSMLNKSRKNKITGQETKDIHEKDEHFIYDSYNNALFVANKYGWKTIRCVNDNGLKSFDSIHREIFEAIKNKLPY